MRQVIRRVTGCLWWSSRPREARVVAAAKRRGLEGEFRPFLIAFRGKRGLAH
jgi:hypothetical protein